MSASPKHERAKRTWLCILNILLFFFGASPAQAQDADQMRLLNVDVNGHLIGEIGQFTLRHDTLYATRSELHDLGIRAPMTLVTRASDAQKDRASELISLFDLPGLSWRLDAQNQTLYVTSTVESLLPSILNDDISSNGGPVRRIIKSGSGVTLNYDVAGTAAGSQFGSSSSLDLRIFTPGGIANSGLLVYTGSGVVGTLLSASNEATNRIVRLDTAYTFADVDSLRRYSVGDFITGGLVWTRPVRLTGVQVRSDFSMRPDLVTFPLPTLSGSAAVPSTVNVLTNGNLVLSREVSPGPFEIPQLPVMNGESMISMTVTNALGQQVTVTQPFYASVSSLAPRLQTFSVQAGMVRRQWGTVSNNYGKLAGVADYRRGLTRSLTVEAAVEATPGTSTAGGGAVIRVGNLGVFNASVAASGGGGVHGARSSFGFQRTSTRFSLGASEMLSTRSFQDVAAINGDAVPRRQLSAAGSIPLRRFGSLGVAYAEIKQDASLHPLDRYPATPQHDKILSVSQSLQFHNLFPYINLFHDFSRGSGVGAQIGIMIPLGRRKSVDLSEGTGDGYGQIRMQKASTQIGEWGYDAYFSALQPFHEFAQMNYKSSRGVFTGGIDQNDGQTTLRTESQGAVSFLDGAFFPSNTIYDSFAIVDTNGLPNVRVVQENRDVGSTDSKGRLLVPDMHAFDLNHLGINPTDVPLDTTIDTDTREIRPQDRSGVIVRFPIKVSHGALLRLIDEAGVPLPVGSTATLRATHAVFPIGYEGETYIEGLSPQNELEVELSNGHQCTLSFLYRQQKDIIPTLGPLRCLKDRP